MQISIIVISREKLAFAKEIDEYLKRFNWSVSFKFLKPIDEKNIDLQKEKEGKVLLKAAEKSKMVVALDERGVCPNSHDFAKLMKAVSVDHKSIAFLVGGAFGLSEEVRNQVNKVISLSALTFPHRFIPLLLAEQLYRSHTILSNHPYHK